MNSVTPWVFAHGFHARSAQRKDLHCSILTHLQRYVRSMLDECGTRRSDGLRGWKPQDALNRVAQRAPCEQPKR
jgi:hypothetical protein